MERYKHKKESYDGADEDGYAATTYDVTAVTTTTATAMRTSTSRMSLRFNNGQPDG